MSFDVFDLVATDTNPPAERETLLERAVNHSRVVFFIASLDSAQPLSFISANIETLSGHKPADFLNDAGYWWRYLHTDDIAAFRQVLQQLYEHGSASHELRYLTTAGSELHWRAELQLMEAAGGRAQQYSVCLHDIGMQKQPGFRHHQAAQQQSRDMRQMQQALHDSEELIRQVLNDCPVPILMSRVADGTVLYESPASQALWREPGPDTQRPLTPSEHILERYARPDDRREYLVRLHECGKLDDYELHFKRSDGSTFWGAVSARLIDYKGEEVIIATTYDLTARRAAEAELVHQREILHQSEKLSALGELLASVAHELNNPLSVVTGQSLLLKETVSDERIIARANKIGNAADRCARIVRTFLAMARQRPSQCAAIDLNEIIETSLEVSTYALRSCAIEVELQLAAALPPVWGNADQLNQVVINLIINAQQALEEHPGPRRLAMITTLDRVSDQVVFTIRDNGPGIPAEIRSRIFEPFFTTKQVGAGTGVGLALCHRIVESHNGCLTVNAAAGGGAEFVIRLPARAVQTSAPSAPQLESETTPALLRILVIDDEADVAELIADILDSDGHRVDIAQSGEAALDKIEQTDFAAIVSDLRMPGLDGPGLYQVLQQNKPWLLARLGFITGDTLGNRVHNFLQSAGRPYIEKPITPQDVRALLHDLTVNTGNTDD